MSDTVKISDPLYVLLGALSSAFLGGIAWLCKNRCRNTEVDCNSGCCRIHTDSRLRETIREEIQRSRATKSTTDIESMD
jgi:hypothetical protein